MSRCCVGLLAARSSKHNKSLFKKLITIDRWSTIKRVWSCVCSLSGCINRPLRAAAAYPGCRRHCDRQAGGGGPGLPVTAAPTRSPVLYWHSGQLVAHCVWKMTPADYGEVIAVTRLDPHKNTLNQRCINVGPASATPAQHSYNVWVNDLSLARDLPAPASLSI